MKHVRHSNIVTPLMTAALCLAGCLVGCGAGSHASSTPDAGTAPGSTSSGGAAGDDGSTGSGGSGSSSGGTGTDGGGHSEPQRTIITNLLNTYLLSNVATSSGTKNENGTDWSYDGWNDDIGWMTNAVLRGYQYSGVAQYLTVAENNWNMA